MSEKKKKTEEGGKITITKTKFFDEYLGMSQDAANEYTRVATNYKEFGLKEEDFVLLKVNRVNNIIMNKEELKRG